MATTNSINSTNPVIQTVSASLGTVLVCNTAIPYDNSIPQNTEGNEVITLSITPKYNNSLLEILFSSSVSCNGGGTSNTVALFQDSTADALAANSFGLLTGNGNTCYLQYIMTSGTTSSTTFKIRIGPNIGTSAVMGDTAGAQLMGGVGDTILTITEYL